MKIDKKELEQNFQRLIESDRAYQKIQKIVERNASTGKIWLIGGYIYRNLISLFHNTSDHKPHKDYDFLVESPNPEIILPFGWFCKRNLFGNPKLCRIWDRATVDFIPLRSFHGFNSQDMRGLQYYLEGVPLDIQSVAYDLSARTLEGERWIQSLETRTVRVSNREKFDDAVRRRKGQTPEGYIRITAESLGFAYSLRG